MNTNHIGTIVDMRDDSVTVDRKTLLMQRLYDLWQGASGGIRLPSYMTAADYCSKEYLPVYLMPEAISRLSYAIDVVFGIHITIGPVTIERLADVLMGQYGVR